MGGPNQEEDFAAKGLESWGPGGHELQSLVSKLVLYTIQQQQMKIHFKI